MQPTIPVQATELVPPVFAERRKGLTNLRVLQIGKFYAPLRGGMETHLKALCDGLKHYIDLKVVVSNTIRTDSVDEIDGVRVTRLSQWFRVAGASVCPAMVKHIRECDADVIHIHWPNPTAVLAYLISGHKGRLILTYHADTVRQRFLGKLFEPVLRVALRRSEAIITSSLMTIRGSNILSRFARRCVVIPFGVRVEDYNDYSPSRVASLRAEYGNKPIILAVGRLVYYKGYEYLIRAMVNQNASLLIIGEGPLLPELQRGSEAAGVQDRVHFLGKVDNVNDYYRACELLVLPSVERAEAFGLVQLEAMACGRPVINTWLPSGVPFVSLDNVTGMTVPPRNSAALAEAIRSLLDDDERRIRYGEAARRRIEQEFTMEAMIAKTLDTYANALRKASVINYPVYRT
jgi:rhamnosyl/mannosyltransferase